MKKILKNDKGSVLVFAAASLFFMLIFASLAIDIGYILTAKNQLQAAVDASALAGASGLMYSQSMATNRAITICQQNTVSNQPVVIGQSNITFPTLNRIRVEATRSLNLFFAPLAGLESATVSANAIAELSTVVATSGLRPLCVPDRGWTVGDPVVIKAGSSAITGVPSYYFPVCYPAVNRGNPNTGASIYEYTLANGCDDEVFIGDVLMVEPGNMVGPTRQGIDDLIGLDPEAYWSSGRIIDSDYTGFSSPRIIKIPLYDPDYPPDSGRNTITVTGFAGFFVQGMQGGGDVVGIYIGMTTGGRPGLGNSLLRTARLVF